MIKYICLSCGDRFSDRDTYTEHACALDVDDLDDDYDEDDHIDEDDLDEQLVEHDQLTEAAQDGWTR